MRRWLSASEEEGPHQEPNGPAPSPWTSQPTELQKINVLFKPPVYDILLQQPEQINTLFFDKH